MHNGQAVKALQDCLRFLSAAGKPVPTLSFAGRQKIYSSPEHTCSIVLDMH